MRSYFMLTRWLPDIGGKYCDRYGTDDAAAQTTAQENDKTNGHHIKIWYYRNRYGKQGTKQ